jgi:hypothetical protein
VERIDQERWHRWVGLVVVVLAGLGGAFAIAMILWDAFGIMSIPIDIVVAVVLVRLVRPARFGWLKGAG